MIRTTPFHLRTSALNVRQRWAHWNGYLSAERFDASAKREYFALRSGATLFDTSPLHKFRITGTDAAMFLGGVLSRNPGSCEIGEAQYTVLCDGDGYVIEDAVLLRLRKHEFLLSTAGPQLSYLTNLVAGHQVNIEDVSDEIAVCALQGPRSRTIISEIDPAIAGLSFFAHQTAKIANTEVVVSRTGFTGDLGYEIWVPSFDAVAVWDALFAVGEAHGLLPMGETALSIARIEAGLLLINVDFESSRFAENIAQRSTPFELGLSWMLKDLGDDNRVWIGRDALRRHQVEDTMRWAMRSVVVDWNEYDATYQAAGLVPPKDHNPVLGDAMVYDQDGHRIGYATSQVYSPLLQRHIALARIEPGHAAEGTPVKLEFTINHEYVLIGATVQRSPLFNPQRKTDQE